VDSNGTITKLNENQVVGIMVLRNQQLHYPAGEYVLLFDGDGDLLVRFDATIIKRRKYSLRL
jgi:hypothetical protein